MQQGIFTVLAAALIGMLFSLSGCSPLQQVIQKTTAEQITEMTPDQIRAWKEAGVDWYVCLQVNGPPPAGAGTVMIVPHGYVATGFGTDCHPLTPPIVINNGQVVPAPSK